MEKAKIEGDSKELIQLVQKKMNGIQSVIDELMVKYQGKASELEAIKDEIRPLRKQLSPYGEILAALASRKSRAKYFPEFATRNFDSSKDEQFLEYVRGKLGE